MRMRNTFTIVTLLAAGLAGLVLFAQEPAPAAGDETQSAVEPSTAQPKIVLKEIEPVNPIEGARIYAAYCADCHGESGRGDGPLADRLGVEIPDLTHLGDASGHFDRSEVRRAIAKSHMVPVEEAENWHEVLVGSFGTHRGEVMLTRLAWHLETLQAPAEN